MAVTDFIKKLFCCCSDTNISEEEPLVSNSRKNTPPGQIAIPYTPPCTDQGDSDKKPVSYAHMTATLGQQAVVPETPRDQKTKEEPSPDRRSDGFSAAGSFRSSSRPGFSGAATPASTQNQSTAGSLRSSARPFSGVNTPATTLKSSSVSRGASVSLETSPNEQKYSAPASPSR